MHQRVPRHTPLWADLDESGDPSQPGTFGMPPTAAECGTEIGSEFPDASAEHASLLTHCIGWLAALLMWTLGVIAVQSFSDAGMYSVPWVMATGAAWILACVLMKRATVYAIERW